MNNTKTKENSKIVLNSEHPKYQTIESTYGLQRFYDDSETLYSKLKILNEDDLKCTTVYENINSTIENFLNNSDEFVKNFEKITTYRCKICGLDCETIEQVKYHFETTKQISNPNFGDYKVGQVIRVKMFNPATRNETKQYILAKIESFEYSNFDHELRIFTDRFCHNRNSDHFSTNNGGDNTPLQCRENEIVKKEELSEYKLFESKSTREKLTEEMVSNET